MDIDSTRFPHKIRMLRACILRILSEMTKVEAGRNESPHACTDPRKSQRVYKKKGIHIYYTINSKMLINFLQIVYPTASAMFGAHAGVLST